MIAPSPTPADADPQAVARVLATLRAGAQLRQAERAVLAAQAATPVGAVGAAAVTPEAVGRLLAELRQREFVQEPIAFSPRPGVGRLLVLARKVMFKLFMKWYLHPLTQQQNAFNQTASRLLHELAAEQARRQR
jgi:hypothetical protein